MSKSKTESDIESFKLKEEKGGRDDPLIGVSPSEKLHGVPPSDSAIPGAQNPDSVEIKKETNPNTE